MGGNADQTLALTTNADGDINYDAILKQGQNRKKHIESEHSALVPKVEGEVRVV